MYRRNVSDSTRNIAFSALLTVALLFAQWTGLGHRIIHGGLQGTQLSSLPAASLTMQWDDIKSHHSCVAFDAATLADGANSASFVAALLPNLGVIVLWVAFASWYAPLICHFSSRAPPLL
jgi:hypothetical protein